MFIDITTGCICIYCDDLYQTGKLKNRTPILQLMIVSSLILLHPSGSVFAAENNTGAPDGVGLGASRVIYPSGSRGVSLKVNNTADNPFLVKSEVLDESGQHEAPFIVTPPLFRLDGGQSQALSIVRTGGDFPADRESINWVCVSSIPPEPDSAWDDSKRDAGKEKIAVAIRMLPVRCVKLFVRPSGVRGNSLDAANKVTWTIKGGAVVSSNPTPFYINISEASVEGKKLKMGKSYIPPFSEERYLLPHGIAKSNSVVRWSVIGDYGEEKEKTVTVK